MILCNCQYDYDISSQRNISLEILNDDTIKNVDLELNYGAGKVSVSKGTNELILKNNIKTSDFTDPVLDHFNTGDKARISLSRSTSPKIWSAKKDTWDITLNNEKIYDISANYGASEVYLDLRNLKVDNVITSSGASKTLIWFENYPTKVDIDTGAGLIDLKFPEGIGVIIDIDGGAISESLEGFTKNNGLYTSNGYTPDGNNIKIKIDAGATKIKGEFY